MLKFYRVFFSFFFLPPSWGQYFNMVVRNRRAWKRSGPNRALFFRSPEEIWCFVTLTSMDTLVSKVTFFSRFSPTVIALGPSAIVKVSGQNCSPTLYGSLGQIRLGLPKGSVLKGSVEVSPRFSQGSPPQVSPRFPQVSPLSLWSADGRSVLGRQKVLWKVPFTLVSQFPNSFYSFFAFVPNSVSFGVFSRSKGLWAKWRWGFFAANGFRLPKGSLKCSPNSFLHWSHSLLRFFWQMAVASEKVLWRVPPTILYTCLPNGFCFIKVSASCALHLSPSPLLGSPKLRELLTCLTHTNPIRRKRPITHTIHVWYIYLHEWLIFVVNVGKNAIHGSVSRVATPPPPPMVWVPPPSPHTSCILHTPL